MSWFYISIIAYFLLAIANLGDKLVVSKYLSSPKVYAITVALLQSMVILLLPFFGKWPGLTNLLLDFATGITFIVAIYCFYTALKAGETSRVVPIIDGLIPIVVLALSILILSEKFSPTQLIAITFLICGGFVLSYKQKGAKRDNNIKYILIAVVAFACSQVLAKITYSNQPFLSAFIWARVGGLLAVIPFLLLKNVRTELKENFAPKKKASSSKAVAFAQVSGGAGFFLQNYAINLGSVGIIAALQGVKYFFLFILIVLLSKKFVQLKEDWTKGALARKASGALLVVLGLIFLVI
jgi:drug/metabolite transporter (DMT)-like permease